MGELHAANAEALMPRPVHKRSKEAQRSGRALRRGERTAPDHPIHVSLGEGIPGQLPGAGAGAAKQPALWLVRDIGRVDVLGEVGIERMMAGHLVPLATFLVQPHPGAPTRANV